MTRKEKKVEPDYSGEIEKVLRKYNLGCSFEFAVQGPTVTRYVYAPETGTKVSSIIRNADKITAEILVDKVRVMSPANDYETIGFEVPNRHRKTIRIEEIILHHMMYRYQLPVALGRMVGDKDFLFDLAEAPHVLIAGNSGSGKTMVAHSIICSILIEKNPEDVQLILAQTDGYKDLFLYSLCTDYLYRPIIDNVDVVFSMLDDVVHEIERRLSFFNESGAMNIADYNKKSEEKLPYIVIVIDGMSEVIKQDKKRFESLVRRITSVARFCGIHFVLTANTISASVITPTIKSNFSTVIALAMFNKMQSRIAVDVDGAETLLGDGDALFYKRNTCQPVRIQSVICGPNENVCDVSEN